ncbi:hypothetical protein M0802_009691 [Mischocyttarus mexicanus]|nr:hypothetical protein M0802_009691 [Mischocyttarus mexicanus]
MNWLDPMLVPLENPNLQSVTLNRKCNEGRNVFFQQGSASRHVFYSHEDKETVKEGDEREESTRSKRTLLRNGIRWGWGS